MRMQAVLYGEGGMSSLGILLQEGVREKVFPGAAAWLGIRGGGGATGVAGWAGFSPRRPVTPETLFDLASLTKVLGTTLAMMMLVEEGVLELDAPLYLWIPEWRDGGKREDIRLFHLLQHTAGLPAHREFYRDLASLPESHRREKRLDLLRCLALEAPPGERTLYSDLGFMLLKEVVERAGRMVFEQRVMAALPPHAGENLFFPVTVPEAREKFCFAATSRSPVRSRRLVGEVHDENTAVMGGVDGHAGLFGTAAAVGRVGMAILEAWHGEGIWHSSALMRRFIVWPQDGKRPLGFDRPSGDLPSCGHRFSAKTVGHLGFTGTSLWLDMERGIVVVLLSNRVHYGDAHWPIRSFRPRFHNGVMQELGQGEKGEFYL